MEEGFYERTLRVNIEKLRNYAILTCRGNLIKKKAFAAASA